jgi:cellulose/xylan binding protein with CBM9 domain
MRSMPAPISDIVAVHISKDLKLNASEPAKQWQLATPIIFSSDWQAKNPDAGRETEVRLLWSETSLYLRFSCRYRELFLYDDSDPDGRRDELWERDVVEAFLQPETAGSGFYKEFEVSPNGMWIDLDIFPSGRAGLNSGLCRSVWLNEAARIWTAELQIPFCALTPSFTPSQIWRANFYRVEGLSEPRTYLAWQPTMTSRPNFHVPQKFGFLRFARQ